MNRVRLQAGPYVAPETKLMLETWEKAFNVPVGYCIDAICQYIKTQPDFRLPVGGYPGKRGPRPNSKRCNSRQSPGLIGSDPSALPENAGAANQKDSEKP